MLVDLGLDDDPVALRRQRPDLVMRKDDFCWHEYGAIRVSTEAQRTSLGCFYLSSMYERSLTPTSGFAADIYLSISSSMMRSNGLSIGDAVIERSVKVAQAAELEWDHLILPLMQYQRLLQDFEEVYRSAKKSGDATMLPDQAAGFSKGLDAWWASLPAHLQASSQFCHLRSINSQER